MKIQVMSDLHFEFHNDGGKSFVDSLDPSGVDALVVAGDMGTRICLDWGIKALCAKYPLVLYVAGNHEYYHTTREKVDESLDVLSYQLNNFVLFEDTTRTICDRVVLGATMWYRDHPMNAAYETSGNIGDFKYIGGNFKDWVYKQNEESLVYLEDQLSLGVDLVITHTLPSHLSVPAEYVGSDLNRFFVCDVEKLIYEYQPKLWIHGHTHDSCDYKIGNTRVVCNPFGYANIHQVNPNYVEKLTLEV